ncbi:hypothetical protein [Vibrio superstes]|uniref:Uncharacterized protein n=1 Tax=Vibrio superstes NBRC 103154 TaxID=1219062 RepID=A0A511QXT7_9VIBR|nr:hypothetical protein [Vibrio superstes]GEM81352.1 hypothetical protein VSU01S_35970 [Vibrio superstes NBRC 103154]
MKTKFILFGSLCALPFSTSASLQYVPPEDTFHGKTYQELGVCHAALLYEGKAKIASELEVLVLNNIDSVTTVSGEQNAQKAITLVLAWTGENGYVKGYLHGVEQQGKGRERALELASMFQRQGCWDGWY